MRDNVLLKAENYKKVHQRKKFWHCIITCVASVVVFCTTYALILPAITLDQGVTLSEDVAYISKLAMGDTDQAEGRGIVDGSVPWDKEDPDADGNDADASNLRVRTFDTIKYDFYYTTAKQNPSDTNNYNSARVYFELLLPATREQAYFSEDEMHWLHVDGEQVAYAYEKELVTIGDISYQVLHGSFLDNRKEGDITSALLSRNVIVRVLNMRNKSIIQPVFTVWLEHNDVGVENENGIPKGVVYGTKHECKAHKRVEYQSVLPDPVMVTCTPRYAAALERGESSSTSYTGDFDFSTGNERALNRTEVEALWNGRMSAYGISLMVKGVDKEHGLRGCEFPQKGETIEFEIRLTTAYRPSNTVEFNLITSEFQPMVWSADAFMDGESQQDGRILQGTQIPNYAAPLNSGTIAAYSCADGGTWTFSDGGYAADNPNHRVIKVTVSGYTFDPKRLPYTFERGRETDTRYYDPKEVGEQYWKIEEAVFSTGEIWVVTPFYNTPGKDPEHYITAVKSTPSLTLFQSIFLYNGILKRENETTKLWKMKESGEYICLDTAMTLQNAGSFNTFLAMIKPLSDWNQPLTDECFHSPTELMDYATPGTYADLEVWMEHDNPEGDAGGVAYNVMAKFDDAFFEPVTKKEMVAAGIQESGSLNSTSFPWVSHAWTVWPRYDGVPGWLGEYEDYSALEPKMLYGTTKDKNGWSHKDADKRELKPDEEGYDDEMMKAVPEDLVWYDTMEELKADGAVCVAVLMEYRNLSNDGTMYKDNPTQMNHLHMAVHGKIKDTAKTGCIYAFTGYAAVWTQADVKKQAAEYFNTNEEELKVWDYLNYSRNGFPSYSPSAKDCGKVEMSAETYITPTHEWSWKRCNSNGNEGENGKNGFGTARKSYFQDETLIAGSGGFYFIDCVYVVDYETQIGLQVAQETKNGVSKKYYSMDAGESVVDFMVTPSAVRTKDFSGSSGETTTQYADVTIQVTLPKGLQYYPGTAWWGGKYQQDDSAQMPGMVTGGQRLVPEIQSNGDGTTLTWILEHVPLKEAMEHLDPIYFSCHIGNADDLANDVFNGAELPVRADIWSTLDQNRAHGPAFKNQANDSIIITKGNALTIIKRADQAVVDIGQPMSFTMKVYNGSSGPYEGWIADILPRNGVGRSNYDGDVLVDEFKITDSAVNLSGVTFYYTTEESYSDIQDITNLDGVINNGKWTKFTLNENLTWQPGEEAQSKPITAIAYHGSVPMNGKIEMKITLRLPGGHAGDVLHNRLMFNNLFSSDLCQIISRTLEGLAWMDWDADGIQDGMEVIGTGSGLLSGIEVSLWKLRPNGDAGKEEDYEAYHYQDDSKLPQVVVKTGCQISVQAKGGDAAEEYTSGRYKFTDLPPGTYAVKFKDPQGKSIISPLIASPVNQGSDERRDSDGEATYSKDRATLQQTRILNIDMPEAKNLQVLIYESKYHDSGFYERGYKLPDSGGMGTLPYTIGGTAILGGTLSYLLFRRKKQKGGRTFS